MSVSLALTVSLRPKHASETPYQLLNTITNFNKVDRIYKLQDKVGTFSYLSATQQRDKSTLDIIATLQQEKTE